jgi:hypothetical protein
VERQELLVPNKAGPLAVALLLPRTMNISPEIVICAHCATKLAAGILGKPSVSLVPETNMQCPPASSIGRVKLRI